MERPTKRQRVDPTHLLQASCELGNKVQSLTQDQLSSLPAVHLQFLGLKEAYRSLHDYTQELEEHRYADKLNDSSLKLQNLQYEKEHIESEIKDCQNYGSKELAALDILPQQEYFATRSADYGSNSGHKLMLERLNFELDQRKSLEDTLNELRAKQQVVSSDNRKRQVFLEQLGPKVTEATTAAQSVLNFISQLPGENIIRKLSPVLPHPNNLPLCLPGPLYFFYYHLTAYIDASLDKGITVQVDGNYEKAKQCAEKEFESCNIHPLHLKVSISFRGEKSIPVSLSVAKNITSGICLSVFYFPKANKVTVSTQTLGLPSATKGFSLGDIIMGGLRPNDLGEELMGVEDYGHQYGYTYKWLSVLCGLSSNDVPLPILLSDFLDDVKYRIRAERSLHTQLEQLCKGKISVEIKTRLPIRNFCSLVSLVEIGACEDLLSGSQRPNEPHVTVEEPEEGEVEESPKEKPINDETASRKTPKDLEKIVGTNFYAPKHRYFRATFTFDKEEFKVIFSIHPAYPYIAPSFFFASTLPEGAQPQMVSALNGESRSLRFSASSQSKTQKPKPIPAALVPYINPQDIPWLTSNTPAHRHNTEDMLTESKPDGEKEENDDGMVEDLASSSVNIPPPTDVNTQILITDDEVIYDLNVAYIQNQVNLHYKQLVPDEEEATLFNLLSYQIRKLKMCLDVQIEIGKKGIDCALGKVLGRPVRGRDRHMAFNHEYW